MEEYSFVNKYYVGPNQSFDVCSIHPDGSVHVLLSFPAKDKSEITGVLHACDRLSAGYTLYTGLESFVRQRIAGIEVRLSQVHEFRYKPFFPHPVCLFRN